MIDTEALRNYILKLAFQGKITVQKKEYGVASDLLSELDLNRIELEKQKISGKKKVWPAIEQSEKYFLIPDTWAWCRIDDVFYHNTGKALNKNNRDGEQLTYITTSNLYWDHFVMDDLKEMVFSDAEVEKCTVSKGDLLVCEGGDFGRAAIWDYDFDMRIQNHVHRLRSYIPVETRYFYYILYYYKHNNLINGVGIGLQGLSSNALGKMPIPLPPLEEQKQIVAKVDASFTELQTIDEFQKQYADNITSLNTKILDLAVRGKLVPQDQNDEPASVLLKKIAEEKQKLVKEGKIKKQKTLSAITEDEIPFDIPESWEWVYLGDLFDHNTGKALNSSNRAGNDMTYITTSNLYWDRFELDDLKSMPFTDAEVEKCTVKKGDLLVCEGGDYGRAAIWKYDFDMRIQNHIHRLRSYIPLCTKYYYYVLWLYKQNGMIHGRGIAIQGLSSGALHKLVVPLPPISEQKRIVLKLKEILHQIERVQTK